MSRLLHNMMIVTRLLAYNPFATILDIETMPRQIQEKIPVLTWLLQSNR